MNYQFKANLGRTGLWSILDWIKNESGKKIGEKVGLLKVREVRVTLLMFSTVLSFALCWLPCTIVVFLYRDEPNLGTENILIAYIFPKFYSLVNPIFYAYTIKDVRKAFKQTFKEIFFMTTPVNETPSSDTVSK